MAVIAVIMPLVMLGVVLALGCYEDLLLPPMKEARDLGEDIGVDEIGVDNVGTDVDKVGGAIGGRVGRAGV
jgi:hypothetical protein